MKNIIVGISLSEQSPIVFKFALRLAQYHSANLKVALILEKKVIDKIPLIPEDKANQAALKKEKELALAKFIDKYYGKQFHTVDIETIVQFGFAPQILSEQAKATDADLIVVGKLTKTGKYFFEDSADKLIDLAACPLFIVPEDAIFHVYKRIVYASNFILDDCESLLFLQPWLALYKAELICLHICKDKREVEKATRKIAIFKKLFPQENIRFQIEVAAIEKGIGRYIALSDSDMVATIHRNRSFWDNLTRPSLSKAIAKGVRVPMLIFQQT